MISSNTLNYLGIGLTILGVIVTFLGQQKEKKNSQEYQELSEHKQNEILELQSKIRRSNEDIKTGVSTVDDKVSSLSLNSKEEKFVNFKKIFKSRFERSIKNFLIIYLGKRALIHRYPYSGKHPNRLIINDFYNSFIVKQDIIESYLDNLFVYMYGSGISTEVLPRTIKLYKELKEQIDRFDNSKNSIDGIESQKQFFKILQKHCSFSTHKSDKLLILDGIFENSSNLYFENTLLNGVYFFRILEEIMLLSEKITNEDKVGKSIFSSGITFETNMRTNDYAPATLPAKEKYPDLFGLK